MNHHDTPGEFVRAFLTIGLLLAAFYLLALVVGAYAQQVRMP